MKWILMTASPPALRPFATPRVMPVGCPIRATLGVLGHKWAFLVLRAVAFYEDIRFTDIIRNNPGLTPRVLTFRLDELSKAGYIQKTARGRAVTYELTQKGADAIPILTALTSFGFKHHADVVFADGRPRTLAQVLPNYQHELLGPLATYALEGKHVRVRAGPAARTPKRRGRPRAGK